MKTARSFRYYFPRGIESKLARELERQSICQSTVVMHRRGGKIIDKHAMDEECAECEQAIRKAKETDTLNFNGKSS
jgi:hypothetical protein